MHRPHVEGENIVAGLGLRLGRHGDVDLAADRGQEIEFDFDFVFLRPGGHQFPHGIVAGRHPMVPQRNLQPSGGTGGSDMHQWQCPRGGTQAQCLAARQA
jgi:hypothetical protein